MRIAVVGATGLVGRKIIQVIEEMNIPVSELILAASEKSVGLELSFKGKMIGVLRIQGALEMKPDFALFSAGGDVSKEWAPKFAENGIRVIDNSSAWRMEEGIPLVVPEINLDSVKSSDNLIANPNCSTIQLLMAMAPIHKKFCLKRMIISTYQSVTGSGSIAVSQLMKERKEEEVGNPAYPHRIDLNLIPHCDDFLENGYTKEEMKLVNESRKILNAPQLKVSATAVRVPVIGGHSESVNIELENEASVEAIQDLLKNTPGIVLLDNPSAKEYPMPRMAHEKNDVFVGRIRKDESADNAFNLWVVSDNLRKGAATNAVQIMAALSKK